MIQVCFKSIQVYLKSIIVRSCRWAFLSLGLALSLLVSCERRPVDEDSYDKAKVPVTIDWVTLAKLDPDKNKEDIYRASVWFFSKDGAVFDGKSYKEFRLSDPRSGEVTLPIGHYSILVFNNSVDEFSDNVGFRGTDAYDTFEYYAKPATDSRAGANPVLEPDILAAWRIAEYEVTPEMVRESRGLTTSLTEAERAQAKEDLKKLLNLQPERLTYTVHARAYVGYLKSCAKPADAVLIGMAHSVKLASKEVSITPSSFSFQMNNRQYDPANPKNGWIESYFETLGMLAEPTDYRLTLRFTLIGSYNGSTSFPASSASPFTFDVTGQLRNHPSASDADYYIKLKDSDNITLPELIPGSFSPAIGDWGDDTDSDIPLPK